MTDPRPVLVELVGAIRSACVFNPEVQVKPACILWPDKDRQWEAIIPRLQAKMPELFVLGDYQPEKRRGPAIWLRCVLANVIEGAELPDNVVPVFYLPGVGRQDLRAVSGCPEPLKPLAELQYRGVIWSQINAKDWTILAYLKSDQGGLGLDVAQDTQTKQAMQLALNATMDEDLELLRGKRLDSDYFNTLLAGGDPVKDLLQWLDRGEAFKQERPDSEWQAFCQVCQSQLAFNPQTEGELAGAGRLAAHEGPWQAVWQRFIEAPGRYPSIPDRIRATSMPQDLFAEKSGWPQWNEQQEQELRSTLLMLTSSTPANARKQVAELEREHGARRELVWAELGMAPLAVALQWLAQLAEITSSSLAGGGVDDLSNKYISHGWKADDAVIQALKRVETQPDVEAISATIRAIYSPWAEEGAEALQKVSLYGYPGKRVRRSAPAYQSGDVVFFVDGLRFDVGQRFAQSLSEKGFNAEVIHSWAALPSVTATGKPAVSPIEDKLSGLSGSGSFDPCVEDSGKPLNSYQFEKILKVNDWQKLGPTELGAPSGKAWCEFGDIDSAGHERGWRLARHIDIILSEVEDRINQLLGAGWERVFVVTDHGWLLVPGGLPKIELPAALTMSKWGRCAILKEGAKSDERVYPWFWNTDQFIALASGISCYKLGEEYTHGGLSLQECLTPRITVTRKQASAKRTLAITDIKWRGLRCNVALDGDFQGLALDIRKNAGDPTTSLVMSVKPVNESGMGSVMVEDEDFEGIDAVIVVSDERGVPMTQQITRIGGE